MNYYNKYIKYKNKCLFLKGGNFGTNPDDFSLDFYKKNIIVNDMLTINSISNLNEITKNNIYPDFLNKIKHVKLVTNDFTINHLIFFLELPNVTKLTIPSYSRTGDISIDDSYNNLHELIFSGIYLNRNIYIENNSCINLKKIIINDWTFDHSQPIFIEKINKLEEIIFNNNYDNNIVLIDNPELKLIIVKNIDFDKSIMLENLPKLEKIDLPVNFKGTLQLKNMTNYINLLFSNYLKLNEN